MKDESEVFIEDDKPIPPPIPYYASLCKTLGGATLALVVTYLEIHHPPANDATRTPAGPSSAPVFVGCDQMCAAIGVNRKTLHIALYCLAVWWVADELRSSASRAGREFLSPDHSLHGKVKPYSIVGTRDQKIDQTFAIRRNFPRINTILTAARIDSWQESPQHALSKYSVECDTSAFGGTEQNLAQIMEKAVNLGLTNGWTVERKARQSEIMKGIWERRKKSGRANKVFGDIEL